VLVTDFAVNECINCSFVHLLYNNVGLIS